MNQNRRQYRRRQSNMLRDVRSGLAGRTYPVTRDQITPLQAVSTACLLLDAEIDSTARRYGPDHGWHKELVRTREVLNQHRQELDHAAS